MAYLGNRPATGENNAFRILDDISSHVITFNASSASVVSLANDTITIPANEHRFITGQRVSYAKGSGGTIITGLAEGVYYIIDDSPTTFKLATSVSNANNSVAVNFTGLGAGTAHTITLAFDDVNTKFKPTYLDGTQNPLITRAAQLVISIDGVIQQPHDSASPTSGFGIDTTTGDLIFSSAPNVNDDFWGHVHASNTVTFDISDNKVDNFTGNGSTTEFTLSKTPPNNENILVTIDGVVQYPSDNTTTRAYTLSENLIQFSSAPGLNTVIQVRHIGFAGPSSGGVTGFYGRTGNVVLKNTDNIIANDATFSGNVSIAQTLTYMDVSYIDAVGIITAQSDVNFNGSGVGISSAYWDSSANEFKFKDNVKLSFGDSQDLSVYHTGSAGYISNTSSALYLRAKTNQNGVNIWPDGVVQLHHSGTEVLETQSWGFWSHGTIKPSADTYDLGGNHVSNRWNDVYIADTGELRLGDGNDLVIVHDGTNATILNTTGELIVRDDSRVRIRTDQLVINSGDNSENIIYAAKDGAVELYHNHVKTFETTGLGIKVSGPEGGNSEIELFADEGDDNNDKWKILTNSNGNFYVQNYGAGSYQNVILGRPQGTIELYHGGNKKFETTNRGIRLQSGLTSGGGISNMLQLDNDGNSDADGSKITFSRAGTIRTEIEALKNETANNETDIVFRTTLAGSLGEKLRITSAGKVLIGTTTPQGNANADDLVVSTSGHSGITIRSGTSHNSNLFFADGTSGDDEYRGWVDYKHNDNSMSFGTNATERLRITSGGQLYLGPYKTNTAGNNVPYEIRVAPYGWGQSQDIAAISMGNHSGATGNDDGEIVFKTALNAHTNANALTEKVRIASDGDVGIAIDTPVARLQVNSGRNAETDRHTAANYHLALRNPADDNGEAIGLSFGITSNATKVGAAILHERDGGGSQGSLQFYTSSDGNSLSERLRISASGDTTATGKIIAYDASSTSNQVRARIKATASNDDGRVGVYYGNTEIAALFGKWTGSQFNTGLNIPYEPFVITGASGAERLKIEADGGIIISNAGTFPTSTNETVFIQGEGHNGHGTTNTRSVFNIIGAMTSNNNSMGLWIGARTNENTAVIGTRTSSGNLAIETYNSGWAERLRITSAGSVNIGGNFAQTTYRTQIQTGTNKFISFGNAAHDDLSNEGSGIFFSRQSDGSKELCGIFNHSDTGLSVSARDHIILHAGGSSTYGAAPERMRITSDGKVGINDSSPSWDLNVKGGNTTIGIEGSGWTQLRLTGGGSQNYITSDDELSFYIGGNEKVIFKTNGDLLLQGGKIYGDNAATNTFTLQSTSGNSNHARVEIGAIHNSDNGGIHFYTAGSSTATQRMVIKGTSGRVGIGQADPQAKLDVSGAYNEIGIRCSGGASGYSSAFVFQHANGDTVLEGNNARHVIPGADAVQDLGISTKRWRNVYTTDLQLSNVGGGGNEVDGTEGTWTLQEGEDDIYMINRKTGKKYKMMLQEVS